MAVDHGEGKKAVSASAGRRMLVGSNVFVMTALAVGVVVITQLIAFDSTARWDMTSTGVNSLSEGTENLLRSLDQNVRLTSLYFETDREDEDQSRYRRTSQDLLDLYAATNRSKVSSDWVNPLKDHEQFAALLARLRERPAFKDEIAAYQERIDKYVNELDGRIGDLVKSELEAIPSGGSTLDGSGGGGAALGQVDKALNDLGTILARTSDRIDSAVSSDTPQYSLAIGDLTTFYQQLSQSLKNIGGFASARSGDPSLSEGEATFLRGAANRYAVLVADVEAETTALAALEPLKFDDLVSQLVPTGNAIVVETDEDAKVVDFSSVWPPMQQGRGQRTRFKDRAFKGEAKLTSAILRTIHKEQTAVVFVRYGGPPPFQGGFMPGQPPAPYSAMKTQLEDANFIVEDWDLKTTTTQPEIDPKPTQTVYVVFPPTLPQRGPMGQPSQDPPFADNHRQAVLSAIGDNGHAMFVVGWQPGPFGAMAGTYAYANYLTEQWGIGVDSEFLLIETRSISPGKYAIASQQFYFMHDMEVGDHDITTGALTRKLSFPLCAPLSLSGVVPEGVDLVSLVRLPARDGVWGVKNLSAYQEQMEQHPYLTLIDGDREGPFELGAAATKGEARIVVVSSANFAMDQVAFAREFGMTSQGVTIRSRNPGNVTLLLNSLFWLSGNTEFMNIGKPIDAAVLEVGSAGEVKLVRAITIFLWPLVALLGGGMVWWVRRR